MGGFTMIRGLLDVNRWAALFANMDGFWTGMLMTFKVTVLGLLLALALGILFGVLSATKIKVLQIISRWT